MPRKASKAASGDVGGDEEKGSDAEREARAGAR